MQTIHNLDESDLMDIDTTNEADQDSNLDSFDSSGIVEESLSHALTSEQWHELQSRLIAEQVSLL